MDNLVAFKLIICLKGFTAVLAYIAKTFFDKSIFRNLKTCKNKDITISLENATYNLQ